MHFCLFAVSCILMLLPKTDKRPYHHWKLLSQTNSSMTDLSVLYSKVNDLWLLYTSYIIIVLWSSLRPKDIRTELPDGSQKTLHPIMFALIVSTMYFTSSSVTYGPAGRHIPTLKSASDTPFTYAGASL